MISATHTTTRSGGDGQQVNRHHRDPETLMHLIAIILCISASLMSLTAIISWCLVATAYRLHDPRQDARLVGATTSTLASIVLWIPSAVMAGMS